MGADKKGKKGNKAAEAPAKAAAEETQANTAAANGAAANGDAAKAPPAPAETMPSPAKSASGEPTPVAAPPKKTEDPGDFWWKCWRCGQKAKVFCVDCKKGEQYLCHRCCAFEHDHDYKKYRFHSMEAINPKQTTNIILAVFDALVLPLTFYYLLRQTGIPEGYNDGIDVCPIVDKGRSLLFSIDAGLSLYTKHYFMMACNIEDGYVRLWIDVFVRNIATNTDSLFLLAVTAFRAKLYHSIVVRTAFVYIAVIAQAVLTTVLYFFTEALPDLEKNATLAPFRRKLTELVNKVQPPGKRLPNTLSRSRPSMQFKDYFSYYYGRIPRQFRWFKESSGNRLEAISSVAFRVPICIRLCCMFLRMGWIFTGIAKVVAPNSFWQSPNIDFAQVSKDTYSGALLESLCTWLMHFVLSRATTVADLALTYTPKVVVGSVEFVVPHIKTVLGLMIDNYVAVVAGLIALSIPWGIRKYYFSTLKSQERSFNKKVDDNVNYPFTTYEARVKFMPLFKAELNKKFAAW